MHLTQEPDFSQTYGFNRIIKVIMVHDLNSKQSIHHSTTFFAKSKKPYFWGLLGQYPQNEIFPKNLAPSVFYP